MKRSSFKFWPSLVSVCGLATASAFTLVGGGDNDGMSDAWEEIHGFSSTDDGTLYPDEAPGADADRDGRTNLQEAEAGTDPRSGVPPAGYLFADVVPNTEYPQVFSVSWHGVAGKLYQLEGSPDLGATWVTVEDPVIGTGGPITVNIEIDDLEAAPRFFWRVEVGDIDVDGDGLTDADEALIGSDPEDDDENDNGIKDGWEWEHFGTLGIDPSADADGDGFTNLQEFQENTDALDPDTDGDGLADGDDSDPLVAEALPTVATRLVVWTPLED